MKASDRIYNFIFTSKLSRTWFRSVESDEDYVEKYSRFLIIHSLKMIMMGMFFALLINQLILQKTIYVEQTWGALFIIIFIFYFRFKKTLMG